MDSVDIRDVDFKNKTYGFHFTPITAEEGLSATGLEARIGSNSSGRLGKEAIPKVFFSTGITGALMTFNRVLNIPADGREGANTVAMLIKDHYKYLPERIKALVPEEKRNLDTLETEDVNELIKRLDENGIYALDYCEGFELVRDWMSDNMYTIFEAQQSQYEHELTSDDISEINAARSNEILSRIEAIDEEIELTESEEEIARLNSERQQLSIEIRKQCMEVASQKRGAKLVDGFFDKEDYNEEHCEFLEQPLNNTHSAIYDDKIMGKAVSKEDLKKLSSDGKIDAVTLIQELFNQRDTSQEYAMRGSKYDVRLLEFFLEFLKLPRNLSQEDRDDISQSIAMHRDNIRGILKQRKGIREILPEETLGIKTVLDQMKKYQESFITPEEARRLASDRSTQNERENAVEAIDSLTSSRDDRQVEEQK